jgi:hypothetical protein
MSTNVSEVRAASIIRAVMETARTFETSADIQLITLQYIPKDSELYHTMHWLSIYSSVSVRVRFEHKATLAPRPYFDLLCFAFCCTAPVVPYLWQSTVYSIYQTKPFKVQGWVVQVFLLPQKFEHTPF